ncbi:MAG: DUF1573 domain-containing protein [Bacteroidaceae bacterium]|jgi:hypothetical protein
MRIKLLLASAFLAATTAFGQGHLSVDAGTHNFGFITYGKPVTASFRLTNIGNDALQIERIETSCACAVAETPTLLLQPGEQTTVKVTYDAKMMGRFHKFVHIYTNNGSQSEALRISLQGEVLLEGADTGDGQFEETIGDFLISSRNIEFEPTQKGGKPTATIHLLNTGKQALELTLLHLPPYISMEAHPYLLPPRRKGKITLTLDTEQLPDYGLTQIPIHLARHAGDKVDEENELTVSAILLPDFSNLSEAQRAVAPAIELSQYEFDLGTMPARGSRKCTAILTNRGKSTLKIEKLQVFSPAVGVSLKKQEIEPGESVKLKMKLNGKLFNRLKGETKVLLISNDPRKPFIIVQLKARKTPQKTQ